MDERINEVEKRIIKLESDNKSVKKIIDEFVDYRNYMVKTILIAVVAGLLISVLKYFGVIT
ncbi:MAG: hypothetical protein L6243_04075 [Candidatus Altiarchaeales archaeon]|nr:hypothetical protein [Candidatus Altiarchaeota archaeon]MBU4341747.1 hypothetical protein [Candidatus Altiarchaeota archaeon]MBU4437587.1 hypothetical protein [Candidatus Altiarchaeota archaeon]MCG2782748.1 hypothetical protein [Candidatus Altiarchaeales archaeon]